MRKKLAVWNEKGFPYFMCAPAVILFSVFTICPFLTGLSVSFFKWDGYGSMSWNGILNYFYVFKDDVFWQAIKNTFAYAALVTVFKNIIALALAFVLVKKIPGRDYLRAGIYMPVMMSYVVIGILWTWIYNPTFGLLNAFLKAVGLEHLIVGWLSDSTYALVSVIWVDIWKWTGYHMVLYIAGLQAISKDYYEAASIDGASGWQKLRYITIPQLNSTIVVNVLMSVTGGLVSNYDIVHIMTDGGPFHATEVSATYILRTAFQYSNMGKANAMSMILFVMTFLFGFLQLKIMTKESSYD
ncbi:MAG TPA: sugar ABC transporter permease [Oscillospiraceae bacterium]|nr:sugar ABC transporter permease [Oscillospiraceae bacterium]HNW04043.1 sugar ABC transporter permease [Oscillospiraceae bacterium]